MENIRLKQLPRRVSICITFHAEMLFIYFLKFIIIIIIIFKDKLTAPQNHNLVMGLSSCLVHGYVF